MVGPSGAGKSTLVKHMMALAPEFFTFSVSSTTRAPRDGEIDGQHYHFTTKEKFLADVDGNQFLEYQEVHGNYYGTHKKQVEDAQKQGKVCILDIDVKGALEIAKGGKVHCHYLFIKTPTIDVLKQRLEARGTET